MSILQEDNTQGRFVVEPKDLSSTEPYQRDNLAHFFIVRSLPPCSPVSCLRLVLLASKRSALV